MKKLRSEHQTEGKARVSLQPGIRRMARSTSACKSAPLGTALPFFLLTVFLSQYQPSSKQLKDHHRVKASFIRLGRNLQPSEKREAVQKGQHPNHLCV